MGKRKVEIKRPPACADCGGAARVDGQAGELGLCSACLGERNRRAMFGEGDAAWPGDAAWRAWTD